MPRKKSKLYDFKKIEEIAQELTWQEARDEVIEKKFSVQPKNKRQEEYIKAIETSVITFATGPAGTGRTYVACATAVRLLQENKVKRIVISRPQLECGHEKVGHLPGTYQDKALPYFRPMLDCFEEFLGEKVVDSYLHNRTIEMAPLAYMRGSSFKDSVILLDEAQNCNYTQLKMVLTRIGQNCRLVVSGDYTQSDLMTNTTDLYLIMEKLESLRDEISFIRFTERDIVRSGIVRKIIELL